jgi:hypothetical protein
MFPNDSPENRAKNRRVDFLIVFPTTDEAAAAQSPGQLLQPRPNTPAR